ncbi:MAG: sigma-70 family RNA polymerase sigma factor [Bacteroidota bacterium]
MHRKNASDSELVRLYVTGSESAIETLINRHKESVFSYILHRVYNRDTADDLFQDTFIKAIQFIREGRYNEKGKFINWIMRIAHNTVIDHVRKEKRTVILKPWEKENLTSSCSFMIETDFETECIQKEIMENIHKLLAHLPEEQREVLLLKHCSNYSFNEIAEITKVNVNTALGRMRYALKNVRKMIKQKEIVMTV